MQYLIGQILVFCLVAGSQTTPPLVVPKVPVAHWPAYGATPGGTHFSNATQVTPENVMHLEQVGEHRSGDIREAGGPHETFRTQSSLQVTPIVIDDRLNGSRKIRRRWLCFDVIKDLLNDVWISDVSDDTHSSAAQRAVARAFSLLSGIAYTLGQKANALDTIGPAT